MSGVRNQSNVVSRRRDQKFSSKASTRIWREQQSAHNPYLAESYRCHGYDTRELLEECSYVEMVYLLLQGELPDVYEEELLNKIMLVLVNPGPRHPATRAVMNAGVSKTRTEHLLPIGLSILGGKCSGAGEVEDAMYFLRRNRKKVPDEVLAQISAGDHDKKVEDNRVAPGFGSQYGGVDVYVQEIATELGRLKAAGPALQWGERFSTCLAQQRQGWLVPGLAAAVFLDLGFHPRAGAGLFQLSSAPGLLAHGLEASRKKITDMPFIDEEHYVVEPCRE